MNLIILGGFLSGWSSEIAKVPVRSGRIRGPAKWVGRKGFVPMCSENKREEIGRSRSKLEQIGAFPETRSGNRNKSEENGRTNRWGGGVTGAVRGGGGGVLLLGGPGWDGVWGGGFGCFGEDWVFWGLGFWFWCCGLSGTGDSQRDSSESIRANHSQLKSLFL